MRRLGKVDACVLGDVDLLRPIALAGISATVVARPGTPTSYSRLADHSIEWADHWTQTEVLAERLLEFASHQPEPPVLYYQSTGDLMMISRNRERFARAFRFVLADAQLIEDVTDKARFHQLATRLEIQVPRTAIMRPADDPTGWKAADHEFPLLLKPVVRQFDKWGALAPDAKAITVATRSELAELWPRLAELDLELLAQELISGPETMIESYHTYIDDAERVVADFAGRKLRTRPQRFGYSTAVTLTDAPDVLELGRDVAQRLGLTGVAKIDFKRNERGDLLLLEVNPRFTLWHHPAALAGLNIPALVFADLTRRRRPEPGSANPGVRWCSPWEDAAAARESGELGVGWLLGTLRCEAKYGLSWRDPMPFVRGVAIPRLRARSRRWLRRRRTSRRPAPSEQRS